MIWRGNRKEAERERDREKSYQFPITGVNAFLFGESIERIKRERNIRKHMRREKKK